MLLRVPGVVLMCALIWALAGGAVKAGPLSFDQPSYVPPVIVDSKAPATCTVTYLVADAANNDLYAARMRIEPAEADTAVDNHLPCPAAMPPRVGLRALDVCTSHAAEAKSCVFADMGRGFEREPGVHNTAENASRCASDKASDLGVACLTGGRLAVCNVACGRSPAEAQALARTRCEDKQQHSCPVTASVPVAEQ